MSECRICYETLQKANVVVCTANKKHKLCSACVKTHLETSAVNQNRYNGCLYNAVCQGHYTNEIIRSLIGNDGLKQLKKQWRTTNLNHLERVLPNFQICPFCRNYGSKIGINDHSIKCNKCLNIWCTKCFNEANIGHVCFRYNREFIIQCKNKEFIEQRVDVLISGVLYRTCPKCNVTYEKIDGCTQIVCNCGYVSCWICEEETNFQYKHVNTSTYLHTIAHKIFSDHGYGVDALKVIRCKYLLELNTDNFVRKTITAKAKQLNIFSKYIDIYDDTLKSFWWRSFEKIMCFFRIIFTLGG